VFLADQGEKALTVVDPTVSMAKFDRQVGQWREHAREHQRRGIFLIEAAFPKAFAVFTIPQIAPAMVTFGAELDFTNYDLWPPSVRVLNPFTRAPFTQQTLPAIVRARLDPVQGPIADQVVMFQDNGEGEAFMCMPGVREYHNHPAHSGDSWLSHRNTGAGTLFEILDKLHEFGVKPINGYRVGIQIAGFTMAIPGMPNG
jgi:hypothetical protein